MAPCLFMLGESVCMCVYVCVCLCVCVCVCVVNVSQVECDITLTYPDWRNNFPNKVNKNNVCIIDDQSLSMWWVFMCLNVCRSLCVWVCVVLYLCQWVYMYLFMCVDLPNSLWVSSCMCVCRFVCLCLCLYLYMCACVSICICECVWLCWSTCISAAMFHPKQRVSASLTLPTLVDPALRIWQSSNRRTHNTTNIF